MTFDTFRRRLAKLAAEAETLADVPDLGGVSWNDDVTELTDAGGSGEV